MNPNFKPPSEPPYSHRPTSFDSHPDEHFTDRGTLASAAYLVR
ncbi:hypothetical protein F3Y22_tig00012370pilonHSYRG00086 [Hibiscus syriacus]|uniref:Uncharacterized protein n=1 Tax=Hibiscus syriacus TaxID=106335 RepID=A0A6A3C6F5_HIBSY|nr:hypothetical protein F3Y22_tig00012370pilonHSYRG00086 [Hibiscus syriacus]